ncbi:VOC family protein [Enterococcus pingfangensis]|uniref:VOC family protein n=1 Tax=Enterococcus pingfangensis TaxID=2559924 RepID=UPI0010F91A14|nr:VOC family protein [Enterococcus pingfangensis]
MLKEIEIMLYVNDVAASAAFWQEGLGGTIRSQQTMVDGSLQVTVELFESVQLVLFDRAFIAEYSPEVINNVPSLLLKVSDLDSYHKRLQKISPVVNPIAEQAGKRLFNFSDPENNYFVLSEE